MMPNAPKFNPVAAQTPNAPVPASKLSPFKPPVDTNPFTKQPDPPPPPPEPEVFEAPPETPIWSQFVSFICRYGDRITQAEYPNPPKSHPEYDKTYVDTIWRGIPVSNGPEARIKHIEAGWVDWADCIK
jgi:hypothetical protein